MAPEAAKVPSWDLTWSSRVDGSSRVEEMDSQVQAFAQKTAGTYVRSAVVVLGRMSSSA
jgi:hypothetical protein